MNKILIVFSHPRFEKSRANRILLNNIEKLPGLVLNDLYEQYPDFNIDVEREKALLTEHDVIIWHYPFYMYSSPAMLKQWMDVVLEYGWAHGSQGNALKDKLVFNALTVGGTRQVYSPDARNRFTIRQFLAPFEQTAALCKMIYLPPFAVHGTHLLNDQQLVEHAVLYHKLITRLGAGQYRLEDIGKYEYLNDWLLADRGQ
ncbi:MAG: NAD(P)H oxidoreductase [Deltaproteobacteria bacterium HGW-Deltaproteobacteria-12]|jgi:glutathione-regulated potassium-efflux system ancillary protein KefG|nr:MAG: NAD(P)H oxidoreductase [Deltaproteobacteria bacterium HGW-Deltaproteobacteria-12]